MNIEIANRLVELRKKSGLSQEELAAKLGLSRQAVSKWERAEASPDTDNLICLAKLYGVSLDTLLNTDESIDEIVKEQIRAEQEASKGASDKINDGAKTTQAPNSDAAADGKSTASDEQQADAKAKADQVRIDSTGIHFKDGEDEGSIDSSGIHVHSKDGTEVHIDSSGIHAGDKCTFHFNFNHEEKEMRRRHRYQVAQSIVSGISVFASLAFYLLMGFLYPKHYIGWGVCWTVFFIIPIASSFVEALRNRKFCTFAFPVLVTGVYLTLGMLSPVLGMNMWHPYWVMFFSIPLYYIAFEPIDKLTKRSWEGKGCCGIHVDDDDDDDDDDDKKKDDAIDVDVK